MDEDEIIKAYNEGLDSVIALFKDMHESLSAKLYKLENKLSELESRLNKNSSNSDKPPSSDLYDKPKNSRIKTGKLTGGQPGHKGKTLEKVLNPDTTIHINVSDCDCGFDLTNVEDTANRRQVFDLPAISIKATEYVTHEKRCPKCGKVHKTEFPAEVTQPVQYGKNLYALMNYLTTYQLLPLERAAETIEDITGQKLSEGTIVNSSLRLYNNLEEAEKAIKARIKESEVVNFDETGIRVKNNTEWLHVASTTDMTYYAPHEKRSFSAINEINILPDFKGTAVHDHCKTYYKYYNCTHSECNAHNLRYLCNIYEYHNQKWAKSMADLLIEIKDRVAMLKDLGITHMKADEIETWNNKYHKVINEGILEDSENGFKIISKKTGKPKKSKALNLILKLQRYDIETLTFMYDFKVPFDNNLAERDLRMQKLRQKISGCFRGKNGAKIFCRIRGYISTARKNGLKAMEALVLAINGNPFIPQTA
jgi:transposase